MSEGNQPIIRVNGKDYPIPDSFTLGEQADMEKITGQGYDLAQGGALGLLAIMCVAIRRVDPSVTVDEIRNLADSDLEIQELGVKDLPPADAAGSSESGGTSDDSSKPGSGLHRVPTRAASGTP